MIAGSIAGGINILENWMM